MSQGIPPHEMEKHNGKAFPTRQTWTPNDLLAAYLGNKELNFPSLPSKTRVIVNITKIRMLSI